MRLLADSGGIIAALNEAEPGHVAFREVLEASAAVYITLLVVTEVHRVLVSYGLRSEAGDFLGDVAGGFYELFNPVAADYSAAPQLVAQYQGLVARKWRRRDSLDLAGAMNVVAAGRLETNLLVATDQDYRTVRPLSRHPAFVLLPLDG